MIAPQLHVVDTHAHLDDPRFRKDVEAVLQRACEAGVREIVTIGTDWETCPAALRIAAAHENVHATVGIHPHDAATYDDALEEQLRAWASEGGVVGLGEIGLDYFKNYSPRHVQRAAFERQAALAVELGLPIVLHNRDATDDALAVLQPHAGRIRGVAHCFGGDAEGAERFLGLGFHISFAGNVTYSSAENLREAALIVPDDRLLVETDCPYLSPRSVRNKRNEPAHVVETLRFLANLRGVSAEALAAATTPNAHALFGLSTR